MEEKNLNIEYIEKLSRLNVGPNDILIITVNVDGWADKRINQYFEKVYATHKRALAKVGRPDTEVLIVPANVDYASLHMVRDD